MTHVITLEFRLPANKEEKRLLGLTETEGNVTKIFINKNQSQAEMVDTVFHEIAHAFMHISPTAPPKAIQEKIARLVGNVVEPCFRRYT
jgi:Zn-dependent peptidase ImmA (M78 family)